MNESGPVYRWRRSRHTGENYLALLPVAVYAYFDDEGTCLYVGHTTDMTARHHHHRSKSPWTSEAGEPQVLGLYLKRGDALTVEARTIRELCPVHNVMHNRPRKAAA